MKNLTLCCSLLSLAMVVLFSSEAFAQLDPPSQSPNLTYPANGATNLPITFNYTWSTPQTTNQYYSHLFVYQSDGITPVQTADSALNGTSITATNLQKGVTYKWRVSVRGWDPLNTDQQWMLWSPSATTFNTFTTNTDPAAPSFLGGQGASQSEIDLSWRELSNNVDGFYVERDGVQIATVPANGTQMGKYQDIGLTPGTYSYRVRAYNNVGTSAYSNTFTAAPFGSPPSVTTSDATQVTKTAAIGNGTVAPNGLDTYYHFEWGLTTTYGASTLNNQGFVPAWQSGPVSAPLNNTSAGYMVFSPGTTYHYRIVATNSAGTSYGNDMTFTTLPVPQPTVTTDPASSITATSAQLYGTVNGNGAVDTHAHFDWGLTTSYGASTESGGADGMGMASEFGQIVTGLGLSTTYHYRIVATNSAGTSYGNDMTFTTLAGEPIVSPLAVTNITATGAQLNGLVNPDGNSTTYYFEYGRTISYGTQTSSANAGSGTNETTVSATLTGLTPVTLYHYRVVATNSVGTSHSMDWTFTTQAGAPILTTTAATNLTGAGAQLNATVNPNGARTSYHFEWGTTTSYGSSTSNADAGSGTSAASVSATLTGLIPATLYHFRIVATNRVGTSYGSDMTFTTLARAPTVTTTAATSITPFGVQLNATVNPNGASTSYHFEWGTTTSYGTQTSIADAGPGTSAVNVSGTLNGLTRATRYHYRIVATNSVGTNYGSDMTFTTLSGAPTVTTLAATNVTATGAQLNGTVDPEGFRTTYYFEYGRTPSYGSSTGNADAGSGTSVTVAAPLSGLSPVTLYHFRIVATNSMGTSYSGDMTFTTVIAAPTLVYPTNAATGVALTAILQWNAVTGATTYGVGVSRNADVSAPYIYVGRTPYTSLGLPDLANNTTYYWQVYAENGATIAPSAIWSFTTIAAAPTVTTTAAINITVSGAQLNGTVNPNGSSTSYHFEWGTTRSYGSSKGNADAGSGTSAANVSATLTGLSPATLYHFRIVATNSVGTSYGSDLTFTTLAAAPTLVSPPNAATGVATNPTLAWNSVSGATSYRLQVSPNADFSSPIFDHDTITGTSQQVSRLVGNTTYYWHVYAINPAGSSAPSAAWSFTTIAAAPKVTTTAATNITGSGAQLNGTVNPNGASTSYHFEWGTTTSYGSSTGNADAGSGTSAASVSATLTGLSPVTPYHYRIVATNGVGANYGSDMTFTTFIAAPAAPTLLSPANAATGVATRATLQWNAVTGATTYLWQLSPNADVSGPEVQYYQTTGTSFKVLLANNTTYYWHVNATNVGGTSSWSATWSFKTIAAAPTVVTGNVTNMTGTSAQVYGSVNPNGASTSYHFEWGTSTSYGASTENADAGSGTSDVNVSATLTALSPGTTYHFRIVATNSGGTNYGGDITFTEVFPGPILVSPANAATGVATNPTLTWNAVTGVTSYWLQVSRTADMSDPVFSQRIKGTSQQVSGLAYNTTYYWQVYGAPARGTGLPSDSWSFTTIVAAPTAPTLASPPNAATGVAMNPTLAWNAVAGATSYELQVSTNLDLSAGIFDQSNITGTSQQVPSLANNTKYYWHVYAMNAGGTSAPSAAWNFTTIVAAPTLAYPTNAATGVATNPILTWNAVTGAMSYQLQVSTNADLSAPLFDQSNITGTSQQVSGLANNTTYYWHVNATNAGGTSSYSGSWSFTTIMAAPVAPTPVSPANAATGVAINPTLTWNAVAGAVSYELQVSALPDFSVKVFDQNKITGTSQQVSGLANNTLYYWHVNATNAGGTSVYSAAWTFTTILASPTLASPASGATGISVGPTTLSWNASNGATSYELQVSLNADVSAPLFDQNNITGTSLQVPGLASNTVYYWHVNATNASGTSVWSGTWSFTTILATPALASPANAATGIAINPTFAWNAVTGATSYRLQVSPNPDVSSPIIDLANITGTSQQVSGLANNTVYYWHVNATNAGGTSAYSGAWSFTTIIAAPVPPTLASPANAATGVATNPTLTWNAVNGATSYQLQVSPNADLSSPIFDQADITGTSQQVSGLANGTVYYWHVDAKNAGGTSAYSAAWSFTTVSAGLAAPILSTPSNDATGQAVNLTLQWNPVSGATTYDVQLATNASFSPYWAESMPIAQTSFTFYGLSMSTTYYWRAKAMNGPANSAWSQVWSFTTSPPSLATPTLVSPANNATNQMISLVLQWNAVSGATSYAVHLSSDPNFGLSFRSYGPTQTSVNVESLDPSTVYYWEVQATDGTGFSLWSQVWSFTTSPASLAAPILATPANSATGQAVNLTLQWNAVPGATMYDVQVATNTSFNPYWGASTAIAQTSFSIYNLSANTTYYWRAVAMNGSANSPWSQVWSFTTGAALTPPVLAIPPNGATGQGTSQNMVWYPIAGVYSYRLQISDDPSFASTFFDQTVGRGWVVTGLASNHLYYWRVNASYGGAPSDWSETWSFTTRGAIQDLPQSNSFALEGSIPGDGSWIPAAVAGVTRADDSKVRLVVGSGSSGRLYVYVYNGTSYQLEWSDVISPGAEIFPVAIGDANNDGKPEIVVSIWPSGGPSDKKIHLYRWNGTGYAQVMEQQLDFMDWGYLTVAIKDLDGDGQNELVATANQINILRYSQATNTFQTVWTSPTAAYNFSNGIQVSFGDVDGDGRPEIVASTSIDAFSTNPSSEVGLVIAGFDGSTYSVKAELRGFAQGLGGVAIGDFEGDHQAEMITGVFNYAIGSYPIYCIKHSGSGYTVSQIATSPYGMFQAHAADIDGDGIAEADIFRSTNSSYFVKYVAGSYQVLVVPYIGTVVFGDLADADQDGRAEIIGGGQVVGWEPPLVAPVLASPANTATGVATNPTLQWNTVSGATMYRVQISTDQVSWFGDSGPISQTNYSFSNLSYSTTYYWRVYASNSSMTSPPSAVWSFTTSSLPAPTLAIPGNASTGIAPVQNIVWYPVNGATSYHLEVSVDPNFPTPCFIDQPNSWGAWTAYGLALNTKYYWRVNATTGPSTSPWSETWTFTTMQSIPILTPSDSFQVAATLPLDGTPKRGVVAGDTRGDGKVRIVAGTQSTGSLYVYLFDGTNYQVEWSGVIAPGAEIIPTAVGDFDNDGMPEILVNIWPQPGYAPSDGKIHMFRWDASSGAYTQVHEQQVGSWACFMPAAIADLDGDGQNELILVDGDIDIFRYSADSKLFEKVGSIPGAAYNITNSLQLSVGDVDGDRRLEIIALPPVYEYSTSPSAETAMLIIGFNGSTYTVKAQLSGFLHGLGGAAVADFDGDGKMEIITAVGSHNIPTHPIYVVKYGSTGYTITQIGTSYPGTYQVHAGDIDGDGIADANIQLNGYGSYFVTYKSGQYQVSYVSGGGAVFGDVADVDGNDKAEIVMASYSELDVFSWNPPALGGTSAMRALPGIITYISKLPDGAFKPPAKDRRHALIDKLNHSQSQYRSGDVASALKTIDQDITSHLVVRKRLANDLWIADQVAQATLLRMIDQLVIAMKNGSATADGVQLADEDIQALPTEYCLYQNYPNPFNPTTQLAFDLPKDGNVSLVVYSILGQEVARLAEGSMPAGRYSIAFAADRLSAGVYYYVLRAGDYRSVKKMLLLK